MEGITQALSGPAPDERVAAAIARWRWPAWIALTLLLYFPVFFARPVFDDLAHVEFAAREGWHLLHMGPLFFRPIERIVIGLNWMVYGDNFWIVKAIGLVVFALNVALVYDLASRIVSQRSPWVPFVIATIFLVHPMHVSAVGKIDTFSEHLASLFALLTVRCAIRAAEDGHETNAGRTTTHWALWAAVAVFLGMMSKEAFAGITAATPLFFVAASGVSTREARRTLVWLVLAEGIAAVAYFSIRTASGFTLTGAHTAAARYHLHLGINIAKNLAAEVFSIGFPGSTLDLFMSLNPVQVVFSLATMAAFLVLFQGRLRRLVASRQEIPAPRRSAVVIVLIAALAAFFPTCLIPELISENQTALALPFVLLLVLAGPLSLPMPLEKETPVYRIALACTCVAAFLCMAGATSGKALAMKTTSDRAYRMGDLILARFHDDPRPTVTVCFEPSMRTEPMKYGVFSVPDDLAAFFQLTRLRIEQPALVIKIEDLRVKRRFDASQCSLRLSGMSVTGRSP